MVTNSLVRTQETSESQRHGTGQEARPMSLVARNLHEYGVLRHVGTRYFVVRGGCEVLRSPSLGTDSGQGYSVASTRNTKSEKQLFRGESLPLWDDKDRAIGTDLTKAIV